jgi:hypothetical protein
MTRKRPAQHGNRLHRREDGFAAPTSVDRQIARAIELLHEHGYGIALRCVTCRRPITAPASIRRHRGPRCEARAKAEQ